MRLTCLKCGHQMELAVNGGGTRLSCVCGNDYTYPNVINTNTFPSERAAEKSRYKAFRAAGLVKNVGGFGLGISLLGILCFPLGLVGAAIGIYVLTMVRGPLQRYTGRRAALIAVILGASVFVGEGFLALRWVKARRLEKMVSIQSTISEDLRALLRVQRLYRASHDTYGTFKEVRFEPRFGRYAVYLGGDDVVSPKASEDGPTALLPAAFSPSVSEQSFTAIAVANLDDDPALDIWALYENGKLIHVVDDVALESEADNVPGQPTLNTVNEPASQVVPPVEQPVAPAQPIEDTPQPRPDAKPSESLSAEPKVSAEKPKKSVSTDDSPKPPPDDLKELLDDNAAPADKRDSVGDIVPPEEPKDTSDKNLTP